MHTYDPITKGAIQMVPIWDCKQSSSAVKCMPGLPDAFTSLFLLLYHRHFLFSWLGNAVKPYSYKSPWKIMSKKCPNRPWWHTNAWKVLDFTLNHAILTIIIIIITTAIYY